MKNDRKFVDCFIFIPPYGMSSQSFRRKKEGTKFSRNKRENRSINLRGEDDLHKFCTMLL